MKYLFRRTLDLFISSMVCSVIPMILFKVVMYPTRVASFVVILLFSIVFLFFNIVRLRQQISRTKNFGQYTLTNCIAVCLYMLVAVLMVVFDQGTAMAWLLLPTKFLQQTGVKTIISAGAMGVLLFGSIFVILQEYKRILRIRASEMED